MILFKNNLINLLILQSFVLNCGCTNTMSKIVVDIIKLIYFDMPWDIVLVSFTEFEI